MLVSRGGVRPEFHSKPNNRTVILNLYRTIVIRMFPNQSVLTPYKALSAAASRLQKAEAFFIIEAIKSIWQWRDQTH